MGLRLLSFLRDWTNPADFPTVEPDEATVRADLQYHPDAIKKYINETLIPSHDSLTSAKHSHDNKTVLDGITADDVAKWRGTIGTFRINVTYSGSVYSADKTFAEIKEAYDAGQLPYVVEDALSGFYDIYILSHFWYDESSAQGFADFECYRILTGTLKTITLRIHSHTLESGSNIELRISEFNAPGGSVVIEGTASDDMSEVTITTPDAWTLVSEAWNSEKRPLVMLRLSDELYAYLTCVSSLDWTSQSTGVALFSLSAQKLLDSTPPYSIWMYEDGTAQILPVDSLDGADGIGIQSVEQTVTSTEDDGANIITVTKTDGTSSTFTVRNGSKGSTGATGASGADGKTAYQYAQEGGYTGTEAEFAAKLAQEQLSGTTSELTPTQVYAAVSAGIPVKVQYTDSVYGLLSFTAFNVAESLNVIVSQTIVYANGVYILAELLGNKSNNSWGFMSTILAQKTDIPSALPNPNALTIKIGSTTVTYDGSTAQTVTIADGTEVSY